MKAQVKIFLPKKTDEVVLCRITPLQVMGVLMVVLMGGHADGWA